MNATTKTPNASGWKPEMTPASEDGLHNGPATTTGNRALMLEEPLLFEIGHAETTGVDLLLHHGVVAGEELQPARAVQVDAAVAHVCQQHTLRQQHERLARRAHVVKLGVGLAAAVDLRIRFHDGQNGR